MKQFAQLAEHTSGAILSAAIDFHLFMLNLFARASQPLIMFGLIYWVGIHLAGYPMSFVPAWAIAWPFVQAIAITTYLAILPGRAIMQAQTGKKIELIVTAITLILLAASMLPLIGQFDSQTVTYIRLLALAALTFLEPEPRPLAIAVVTLSTQESEEDDDEHPFAPIRVQD